MSFWRSREDNYVKTSYLLSSAPRISVQGLGWAPSSPTAHLLTTNPTNSKSRLLSHDGRGSVNGTITSDGLLADWLTYDFTGPRRMSKAISTISRLDLGSEKLCRRNIQRIRNMYLKGYRWGSLLRPIKARTEGHLLQLPIKSQVYRVPAPNPVDISKILLIVCAANDLVVVRTRKGKARDDRIHWEWKGIYEWDLMEPLPEFKVIGEVLIV